MRDGSLLWKYRMKALWSGLYLQYSPIVMGDNNIIYVASPIENFSGGICAINASTGKLIWSRVTDEKFEDFQYKFAYSARYHMIVRLCGGYLMAIDSRDGHVLWTANITSDKYIPSLQGNVVIAKNHIYAYHLLEKYPSGSDKSFTITVRGLTIYDITDGKIIYEKELTPSWNDHTTLDIPDIAVSDGKVLIADEHLYVYVHDDTKRGGDESGIEYAGISVVAISGIVALAFVVRKRK